MCGYVLVRSLGNINGTLVVALGKVKWSFYWGLALTCVVPAAVLAASRFETPEAVIAALLGVQVVFALLAYFYWVRRLIGPCLGAYAGAVFVPWLCGGFMAGVVRVLLVLVEDAVEPLQLAIVVPAGGAAYILMSFLINRPAVVDLIRVAGGQRRGSVGT
jgi:hypothetical protein